jgi:hypothetical protein
VALESARFQPLEPVKCENLVSKLAFKWVNLHRYPAANPAAFSGFFGTVVGLHTR